MSGQLAIVLHAHLPFVRHPEHEKFLEESWLYEAITECYLPLLEVLEGWRCDGVSARLTLTLSPTLCAMLQDDLLRGRYVRHLNGLIELAERETHRTHWEMAMRPLAEMYHERFRALKAAYDGWQGDLVGAFRKFQELGLLEIITTAATHALLPLLVEHPPSLRAQVLTACEHYRSCFGCDSRGIWLPECAYAEGVEAVLQEADIRWFLMDTHGVLNARPKPRYGVFAPIYTPGGVAAFARDMESARQVWSRDEGYPGDPRYRDFYRDIGFDLDLDYLQPYLPAPGIRGFTGIKYHRITSRDGVKAPYERAVALHAADGHAAHFLQARVTQFQALSAAMDRPPLIVSPYDAELFGHWWHEGPEFLDLFVRKACYDQQAFTLTTPMGFLQGRPSLQIARPSPSTWGEDGHLKVWLNESNQWIYPHLRVAQERMTELARRFASPAPLQHRALKQAARELLLAQSSDWPFILRTGTSPEYARRRVKDHLLRFLTLYEQLTAGRIDESELQRIESLDNVFPGVNPAFWR